MIPPLTLLAEAAPVDPTLTSLVSLLTSLGPTGGALATLWFCLDYWKRKDDKDREERQREREERQREREQDREQDKQVRESLRDLVNQQGEVMRQFTSASNGLCRYQIAPPIPQRRQQS